MCATCDQLQAMNHELIAILNRLLFEKMIDDIEAFLESSDSLR